MAYQTGRRAVEMVWEDLKPSKILTRKAFENAIIAAAAAGCSTNCPPHVIAIARHIGVELDIEDWEMGHDIPLLVNMQPAGEYLGEEFHRAGGVPAVIKELIKAGRFHADVLTVTGKTMGENHEAVAFSPDRAGDPALRGPAEARRRLRHHQRQPLRFRRLETLGRRRGFRKHYLENPGHPGLAEGRAIVFEGPEDYHHRIDDPTLDIDEDCFLFIRNCGPVGYPGAAEVVNMRPPAKLIEKGIWRCRRSATAASRDLGEPVDPQRLARGRGRRQSRDPAHRRPGTARHQQEPTRRADRARRRSTSGRWS